jgi:hypothetical protein
MMDATLLKQLLYEDESATLDFKKEQYKFVKATDDEKSELLKDILGFANGWRRADAYILIGVEEVRGGRSTVVGIADHLSDHSLQQFINNLTNRPVRFGYEVCSIDGKQIGVIRIEQQDGPIYLKKDYGKLKRGEVYVRRGSSTDWTKPATPEEIALMGKAASALPIQAELSVEFADPKQEKRLGCRIEWSAEYCCIPESSEIPMLDDVPTFIQLPGGGTFHSPNLASYSIHDRLNARFYRQLAEFEFVRRLCRPVRLVIINTGTVPASEVRIEASVPHGSGFGVMGESDIPDAPQERKGIMSSSAMKNLKVRPALRHPGYADIETNDHRTKIEIDCGNLQPGRRVWTDTFYIGIPQSGEIEFSGNVFAANLVEPKEFTLSINADITQTSMTVDELIKLADGNDVDDGDDEYEED